MVVGDAQWKAKQTPGAKYDTAKGFDLTKPKIFKYRMFPVAKPATAITKPKRPDPGTYDTTKAFEKTQKWGHETKAPPNFKAPKKNFLDAVQSQKKFVPPPGSYNHVDCYKKLSPSPVGFRMRRH